MEVSTSGGGSTPRYSRPGTAGSREFIPSHNQTTANLLAPDIGGGAVPELPGADPSAAHSVLDIPAEYNVEGSVGADDVVYHDLQLLLGNGNWAPWFSNSVSGYKFFC